MGTSAPDLVLVVVLPFGLLVVAALVAVLIHFTLTRRA